MSIKAQIETDLKKALKNHDNLTVSVLRLLLSEIHNLEINRKSALDDETTMGLLRQSVKRHNDSASQFRQGGREDLAAKEDSETAIIASYLPPVLSNDELASMVEASVTEAKKSGALLSLGSVMKILMPKVKGRADGQAVSNLVKQKLNL